MFLSFRIRLSVYNYIPFFVLFSSVLISMFKRTASCETYPITAPALGTKSSTMNPAEACLPSHTNPPLILKHPAGLPWYLSR